MTSVNPWRHVDADDDLVADLLAGTVEAVVDAGGRLHPDVRFVVRDGQAHVECDAPDDTPLISVPREAFVRIGRVGWSDSLTDLEFDEVPETFSALETQLLILQTAFHRACGKIPRLVATHPVLADLDDDLIDAVRAFRPSFRRRQPTATSLFWSNRVFRLPSDADGATEPMAVPLVDLLDHDHRGAAGTWTGDAFAVHAARPLGGTECRLDYGLQRDAIGMAVVYGFVDVGADIAHSAPIEVGVPGIGAVRVLARGRSADGSLCDPRTRVDDGTVVLSHLSFRSSGTSDSIDARIVHAVAQENLRLLDALAETASATRGVAASTLAYAATIQAGIIRAGLDASPR